ncbi:hypothetical protein OZX65_00405 [Leuconostocaceae bacterium ESL0723]|nr:hypothetical protein [Lactobacillaceae bacterium L1_55_11]WEV54581.1 hypothetical protein OZX65_00405 [Leuconostocaceae bacterium ESL0723]
MSSHPISHFFKKLLHHPKTMAWMFPVIMVALMTSYNTFIRYGWSEKMFAQVFVVYPLIVIFIYYFRALVTYPLALRIHRYFPDFISDHVPARFTVPMVVIMFNVSVMMVWFTDMHHKLYPHFLPGYTNNWLKSYFVAVPIYLFIVRPAVAYLFEKLQERYPLIESTMEAK